MSFCLGPLDPSSLHHPQPARCSWLRQEDRTDLSQLMQPWQLRASHHTAPQEQMSQSHPSRSLLSQTVFSPTYSTLGAELRCSGTALLQVLSWEHNPKKNQPSHTLHRCPKGFYCPPTTHLITHHQPLCPCTALSADIAPPPTCSAPLSANCSKSRSSTMPWPQLHCRCHHPSWGGGFFPFEVSICW